MEYHGAGGIVEDWLFLAMAEHGLGHAADARTWFDKATAWLAHPPEKHPNGSPVSTRWKDRLTWSQIRREAESLVQPASP